MAEASSVTTTKDSGLRFAGDVNLEKVEVISGNGRAVDITNLVAEIQIFEDLFAPCTTGTIALTDSTDLVNLFPFVGEEKVKIKVKTPSLPDNVESVIDREFYIFKMSDRKIIGDHQVFYVLHFCSFELLTDANVKLSKAYSGKISQIASQIIKSEVLKTKLNVQIEDTVNSIKYVSNYWSPYKNLNFLAERALNNNGSSSYIFYENRLGLNFVSLEGIFNQTDKETYTFDTFSRIPGPNGTTRDPEKDFGRFLDYNIETGFDYIQRISSGMFGSKMISHDILTKKYSTKNFTMFDDFAKQKHLNPYPVSTTDVAARLNSNIYTYPKYNSAFNGFGDDGAQNWLQKRTSLMSQAHAYRLTAEISGRTDITVGQTIKVQLYKTRPIDANEPTDNVMDNMFSGRYVISAINHRITRKKHEIHMECLKDSLIVSPKTGTK